MHGPGWESAVAVGIDVGGDRLHVVGLGADLCVCATAVLDPRDHAAVGLLLASVPAAPVAIDGPDGPSSAPFADDGSVSRKFRSARGCEVELGRQFGIWVPFVTPTSRDRMAPWMTVASDLFDTARILGHEPLEVYPYAVFTTLAGRRLAKKTTPTGVQARVEVLLGAGVGGSHLAMWSHDSLDAAAAAIVAAHHRQGIAASAACPRDGTAIWLPSAVAEPSGASGRGAVGTGG